jgi:ParB family transcriptional regulator, chromosome partitioning protein
MSASQPKDKKRAGADFLTDIRRGMSAETRAAAAIASKPQSFSPLTAIDLQGKALAEQVEQLQQSLATERERAEAAEERAWEAEARATAAAKQTEVKVSSDVARTTFTSEKQRALEAEIARLSDIIACAGDKASEFRLLACEAIVDRRPPDRFPVAFSDASFQSLLNDIKTNGQLEAILVRPIPEADRDPSGAPFELVIGRRRLEACRHLGTQVLARISELDDEAALRATYSENEHRSDISVLERAHWFAAVKLKLGWNDATLASAFGVERSTLTHLLRVSRLPSSIVNRLRDPRRMSIGKAKRLLALIDGDSETEAKIIAALDDFRARVARGDRQAAAVDDIALAIEAAEGRRRGGPAYTPRPVYIGSRQIGSIILDKGKWQVRFGANVDDALIDAIADRLPEFLEQLQASIKKD